MNLTLADIVNIVFVSSATVGGDVVIANFDPKNLYTDNSGALYVQCHPMSHWNLLFSVYQKDGWFGQVFRFPSHYSHFVNSVSVC